VVPGTLNKKETRGAMPLVSFPTRPASPRGASGRSDQALFHGQHGRLGAIIDLQLLEDVADVISNRVLADGKLGSDDLVRLTSGHHLENLALSRAQGREEPTAVGRVGALLLRERGKLYQQAVGQHWLENIPFVENPANRVGHSLDPRIFGQESARARLHGRDDAGQLRDTVKMTMRLLGN